jgi:hypothetical protein
LTIYDVEEVVTHGGSLRIYACHSGLYPISSSVEEIILREAALESIDGFKDLQSYANLIKDNLLTFLIQSNKLKKKVFGYGAAAKGNTLLNYAGVKSDLLSGVFDASPSKQGKYLPGSHVPIMCPELIMDKLPDCLIIFPWNIAFELAEFLRGKIGYSGEVIVVSTKIEYL